MTCVCSIFKVAFSSLSMPEPTEDWPVRCGRRSANCTMALTTAVNRPLLGAEASRRAFDKGS